MKVLEVSSFLDRDLVGRVFQFVNFNFHPLNAGFHSDWVDSDASCALPCLIGMSAPLAA